MNDAPHRPDLHRGSRGAKRKYGHLTILPEAEKEHVKPRWNLFSWEPCPWLRKEFGNRKRLEAVSYQASWNIESQSGTISVRCCPQRTSISNIEEHSVAYSNPKTTKWVGFILPNLGGINSWSSAPLVSSFLVKVQPDFVNFAGDSFPGHMHSVVWLRRVLIFEMVFHLFQCGPHLGPFFPTYSTEQIDYEIALKGVTGFYEDWEGGVVEGILERHFNVIADDDGDAMTSNCVEEAIRGRGIPG